MNITSATHSIAATTPTRPIASVRTDPADDPISLAGAAEHGHREHRGGPMTQAMTQALQSLGLTLPQAGTAGSSGANGAASDSDGDHDGSGSAAGAVRRDLRRFIHALFQAVRNEPHTPVTATQGSVPSATTVTSGTAAAAATGTTTSTVAAGVATAAPVPANGSSDVATARGERQSGFAAGLSALITQVSGGSAPARLQAAFDKLMADLTGRAPVTPPTRVPTQAPDPILVIPETQATTTAAGGTGSNSALPPATTTPGTVTTAAPATTPSTTASAAAPAAATAATPTTTTISTAPVAAGSAMTTAPAGMTIASNPVTLQALLSALQQGMGYGRSHGSSLGNSISTQA